MKRLWLLFSAVVILSFSVLGWIGTRIYQEAPPIADKVVTTAGVTVVDSGEIQAGQNVWQSLGGMQVGSIWGHGSYVAPDWTADWLHREAVFILRRWSNDEFHSDYDSLSVEQQAQLSGRLTTLLRANTYDQASGTITIDPLRAEAFAANRAHFSDIFSNGHKDYAIPAGAVTDESRLNALSAFFFWSSWAASTNRPDSEVSYTNNWPYEPLVANRATGDAVVWTGVSIIMLLAGISAMAWWYAARRAESEESSPPTSDPLELWKATPSQQATVKYFGVVSALILLQMLLGVIVAHYGVEGDGFYGFPLSQWLPYSVARTWHVQIGLFWIATAWLAAGLFIGPLVSEQEPKGQRLGVNVLFAALLVIVVGSLAGEWLSVHNYLSDAVSFYWGHQGYEYVDLGRIWQIGLLIGLLLWLFLMVRVLLPALRQQGEQKQLVALLAVASTAIALFYGAGLTWGRHTNLSIVEYWRWWVVHLWVEGFFEVFATTVIAFVFMRLNLIRPGIAAAAALLSATIFLAGGIIGTCHHLYFSGTPPVALAWGSVFSALEVVPLVLVGFDATEDLRRSRTSPWVLRYKWPIYFFIAVAFWNMIGAGLFGFMINPPIALYYMQGLNTTPLHGHAALFGVYGMLGIGLMLLCLRVLVPGVEWKDGLLRFSFWALNGGLMAMCLLSLLPVGLMQTWASVEHGYWYARSAEFMQTALMQNLRWMRVPGDTLFFLGAVALVIFVAGLKTGHSFRNSA
ncbi:MAG: nitric-oxide reductase large subunit [Planctomycetaceae bacterium]|uniref:Nitric oxide reductase subunit B n=1 Tax=Lacipirellula limnantheis TaxID=2528024 RepID=A0A517TTT4_9BACT|nr:nitric-oxide reductase large subunit [Lacipirellula limnantheis]MBL9165978.1 nitric-oxide reductase large subunit [Planctomycetaceae bacterium]QDT71782.1 Nitric oxide reductase subunit B [Lacipirellula limnantheis]